MKRKMINYLSQAHPQDKEKPILSKLDINY